MDHKLAETVNNGFFFWIISFEIEFHFAGNVIKLKFNVQRVAGGLN